MGKIPQQIKPAKGYLLLEPADDSQVGDLQLHGENPTPQRGIVLAVGGDTWHEGLEKVFEAPAKKGDTVIHSGHGFEDIRVEGEKYRLCPFGRVLATVKK